MFYHLLYLFIPPRCYFLLTPVWHFFSQHLVSCFCDLVFKTLPKSFDAVLFNRFILEFILQYFYQISFVACVCSLCNLYFFIPCSLFLFGFLIFTFASISLWSASIDTDGIVLTSMNNLLLFVINVSIIDFWVHCCSLLSYLYQVYLWLSLCL